MYFITIRRSSCKKKKYWIADMPINMSKDWNIQEIIYFFFFLIMHFSVFETLRKKYLWFSND